MTIAELLKELNDSTKDRIKNPIVGAFICSFIAYNWRPIFILLFSDLPVEDRIEFVNYVYCNKWGLIVPIIFGIAYTLVVPLIMILMDFGLMPMKRKRIANIYYNKGFTTDQKTLHAVKERGLKNAESGNKDIDDLNQKIKALEESKAQLEESIVQIRETEKLTIDGLNQSLSESNSMLQKLRNTMYNERSDINLDVYEEEINGKTVTQTIAGVLRGTIVDSNNYVLEANEGRLNFMINTGYVENTKSGPRLTREGKNLWEKITS